MEDIDAPTSWIRVARVVNQLYDDDVVIPTPRRLPPVDEPAHGAETVELTLASEQVHHVRVHTWRSPQAVMQFASLTNP